MGERSMRASRSALRRDVGAIDVDITSWGLFSSEIASPMVGRALGSLARFASGFVALWLACPLVRYLWIAAVASLIFWTPRAPSVRHLRRKRFLGARHQAACLESELKQRAHRDARKEDCRCGAPRPVGPGSAVRSYPHLIQMGGPPIVTEVSCAGSERRRTPNLPRWRRSSPWSARGSPHLQSARRRAMCVHRPRRGSTCGRHRHRIRRSSPR